MGNRCWRWCTWDVQHARWEAPKLTVTVAMENTTTVVSLKGVLDLTIKKWRELWVFGRVFCLKDWICVFCRSLCSCLVFDQFFGTLCLCLSFAICSMTGVLLVSIFSSIVESLLRMLALALFRSSLACSRMQKRWHVQARPGKGEGAVWLGILSKHLRSQKIQ